MDIKSTLYFTTENTLENQIRKTLNETYANKKPSKKTLNAIMSFAASCDCVDTKIGKVDIMFN